MDVDPMEYAGGDEEEPSAAQKEADRKKSRLNAVVAVTVALLATFMAICNVKDGNVQQNMQQAQAKSLDNWAWYQARKIRVDVAQGNLDRLTLDAHGVSGARRAEYDALIKKYQAQVDKQTGEMDQTQKDAKEQDELYDKLNYKDDQFDAAEALLALTVSLLAVTSLTQKRWLYFVAIVPMIFGAAFGLSGLFGWHFHPDLLAKWLS
jgi:hypothetical protein